MPKLNVEVFSLIKELEVGLKILVETRIASRYRSVFIGKGLEFEEFRNYSINDDATNIDWKASIRANKLLVKRFKEERDLDVFFLLDVSSSMIFGSTRKLKIRYAAEVLASLSYFIIQSMDRVGLFLFTDKIIKAIPPSGGNEQFYTILKILIDSSIYGGKYDLSHALRFLMRCTKKRGLLFIVSDFIGLKNDWDDAIRLASAKFDIVGIMIRDPRDEKLPIDVGQVVVGDPFSDKSIQIDPARIKKKYESYARKEEKKIREVFLKNNCDFVKLSTDKSFIKPIIELFKKRWEMWK